MRLGVEPAASPRAALQIPALQTRDADELERKQAPQRRADAVPCASLVLSWESRGHQSDFRSPAAHSARRAADPCLVLPQCTVVVGGAEDAERRVQ